MLASTRGLSRNHASAKDAHASPAEVARMTSTGVCLVGPALTRMRKAMTKIVTAYMKGIIWRARRRGEDELKTRALLTQ